MEKILQNILLPYLNQVLLTIKLYYQVSTQIDFAQWHHNNLINAKFICLALHQVQTTALILMKFGVEVVDS